MGDVLNDPAFAGFGQDMLPTQDPSQIQPMRPAPIKVLTTVIDQAERVHWDARRWSTASTS
jgi:hypothetical protein